MNRALRLVLCASAFSSGLLTVPAAAQVAPYKIAEADLAIDGLSAEVEGQNPVVPKNVPSGLRVIVRAGGQALTLDDVERFLGAGFEVRAEVAGPGLRQVLSLPLPDQPPSDDPLLLRLPGLTVAGDYTISGLRIVGMAGSRTLLDVAPRQLRLRVIEQILVTSVLARPLTMAEIQDKGILVDADSYLGFEFTIALLLDSQPIQIQLPVTFNREGVPMPPTIPLPPPIRRVGVPEPSLIPVLLGFGEGEDGGGGGGSGGGGGGGLGGAGIPSILVIPGSVGYMKEHFSAQLFVANGAPAGSPLTVDGVSGTIHLPPGADGVAGTADDPLVLAPLVDRTPSATLPVLGVGPDGQAGTADDVAELSPGALGQAEFLLRGEREGFHNLSFDVAAELRGLPTGPVHVTGHAKGGVLVRNASFDMTFIVPNVVRVYERFKIVASITNIGRADANGLRVTIDRTRMSGLRLRCPDDRPCQDEDATRTIGFLAAGDSKTVEFEFESQRTGAVVASYLHFDTGGTGRLNFTVGMAERGVPLSPDTLVLPTSLDGLPSDVVAAAMRVLGQAWSNATAPRGSLRSSVLRIEEAAAKKKMVALAEAGLRVQLGQPPADSVRDLAFDFWGGTPLDEGFDQLLRETEAGRNLAFRLGDVLAGPAGAAGGPAGYERTVSEIAAAGSDFVAVSVKGTGAPVGATLSDAAGRKTVVGRSQADGDIPLSQVPGAAFLPLGPPASAPSLGILTAPTLPPYVLQVSGPAELSVTFPDGNGRFQRGTLTTAYPARVRMDFAQPEDLVAEEDRDGDGTFETPHALNRETVASQGPRLVSASVVGPETVAGASVYGVHAALLFDRVVGEESAAEKSQYQIPSNQALSAKRQLSGRLVFLGLEQPEGPYVPTTVTIGGLEDTRGVRGPAATLPLTSRLREIGAVVSGRVINADGTPYSGGPVFYSQYNTNHQCRSGASLLVVVSATRPSSEGRYQFRYVPRDPCGFPFQMAIYDPLNAGERAVQLYVRTAGEQMVADLALMGRGTVAGVVRDAAGNAVPGARVVALSVTDARVGGQATTRWDGYYEIPNIVVGGVNVRAGKGILVGQAAGRIERAGGTATVNVRLEAGSARLSGRVFKLENGETTPAPGVYVLYSLASDQALLGVARTDDTGRYVLEGMPAGNFGLEATLYAGLTARITGHVDEGQALENLDLVIVVPLETQLGSVQGTVRYPNAQAASGVVVRVDSRAVLTGSDGSYRITGLPLPSTPTVLAETRDAMRSGQAHAFLTTANPNPTGIDITLSGVGMIRFTVLDPSGLPIAGQSVSISGRCGNPCGCATRLTDAQGVAEFSNVRLGMVSGRALHRFDGIQDVAWASVNLERDGQAVSRVMRFGGVGAVQGVVRDQTSGLPIHGATVYLKHGRYDHETCGLKFDYNGQTSSATDGRFAFSGINAGQALAVALQPFYGGSGSASGTLAHGQTLNLNISLRNTMAGGLSGAVFLPDGVTPAGEDVEVTVNGVLPDVTVHTFDDEGHYEFAPILPAGYYTLTARGHGFVAQKRIYLRAQQDAVHDVRLLGMGTVEVTVADGGDQVVDNASVRLRQTEYPFRTYDGVVQPATGGVVRFDDVVEGPFTVEASDAFGRGGRAPGQLAGPDQVVSVRVRLTVTGSVRGRFIMPDGSPIPYGTVRLTTGGRAVGQVTTRGEGEVGAFAFDYVHAGLVRLDAEDPNTARTGLAVGTLETEDQELVLDVRAQALGTVRGFVTGDGTPQPGALVEISSGTYRVATAADSEGWYEVPGVPEGRIAVTASLQNGYLKATESATLAGEGTTLQIDVALRPSGTVQGTVVEANGTTPARAAVSVTTPGAYFVHHTTEQGFFDFTRVAAGSGWLLADELASIDYTRSSVQVPAGGTVQVTLRLNGVGSLRGQAHASDGGPTGGSLTLIGGTQEYRWSFAVNLGPDGLFYLPEVLAGPFTATLRVQPSGGLPLYGTVSGTIQPDQETVLDVQVQHSGTVTGVVLRAGRTAPAFGATVALVHEKGTVYTQVMSDGRFTFRGVPLGTFTVSVHDEFTTGRVKVRNQQVTANGQTVDLGTLELDAVPPTLTVVEPADGTSRPPLGGPIVVDASDAQTGVDPASLRIVYANGWSQTTGFTFADGRFTGTLNRDWQVIGANTLRFEVQDFAGNLTQRTITYTATGSTLQGVVRLANGSPAPNVQVFVGLGSPTPVVTDSAGAYVKGGLRPAGYWIWAVDPATGISTGYDTLTIFDGETRQRDLTFPAFGWIGGVVRHANGSPAPGAVVSYGQRSTTAGTGGVFNLGAFNLGAYQLTASEPARGDRGAVQVTLSQPGQTVTTEIRLTGVGTVTATVRNADGSPVAGALARAWSSSVVAWYGGEQPTAANGTTSWSQALAGTITVIARDPARNLAGQASGLLSDNGSLSLTVTLEPAGSVIGTVYRAGGTSPAANVNVVISGAASRTVQTDSQGRYSILDVRLSGFQLVATDPANGDTGRASGVVSSTSPVTANITLNGVGNVRVTVRKANGDPAEGAAVVIGTSADIYKTYTGTTAADGTITLTNVLAGNLTLRADLPGAMGSGQATATLAPGQSQDVTITLEAVGTIRGRVFAPDGVSAAPGVALRIYVSQRPLYATSAADGSFEFREMPLRGGYYITALVGTRVRAQSPYLTLSTPGQVLVQDVVLVGVGTVSGVVTDPAGAAATGVDVRLQIGNGPHRGTFATTSGAGGSYSLADVPVGPFNITATRDTQNVDLAGAISQHGEALTINLQLLANSVSLPFELTDANRVMWRVQTDGSLSDIRAAVATAERALKLTLVEGGTLRPFTGGGASGASEHAKREIVVRQSNLAGLNVTRKTLVSATGYFGRSLEILENPSAAPVTVDVVFESQFGSSPYYLPLIVDSADGDAVATAADDWIMVDDSRSEDIYTSSTSHLPPVGIVLAGPGGLRPSLVTWDGPNRRLTTRWDGVTLTPGQKAGFVTLITPQADRGRARASAQRLTQMPPEALFGLTPEEAAAVRNVLVPVDLASALEALPPLDGIVKGKLLGGDGQTPIPGRVTVRSRSPHYGRPFDSGYNAGPDGSFEIPAVLIPDSVNALPRTDFDLTSTHSSFVPNVGQTTTVHGIFPDSGIRNLSDVTGRSLIFSSQAGDSYSHAANAVDGRLGTHWRVVWNDTAEPPNPTYPYFEVVLPADATIHEVRVRCSLQAASHVIRRARIDVKAAGGAVVRSVERDIPVDLCAVDVPLDPVVEAARSVRITSLADGRQPTIAELEILGTGPFSPSRLAQQDLLFTGRGVLEGRLLRSDQTPIVNGEVKATNGSQSASDYSDATGLYRFPVVPPGTYTLEGNLPLRDHSVTVANVVVAADQKTTQDIVFVDLGRLRGTVFTGGGQPIAVYTSLTRTGFSRTVWGSTYDFADVPPGSYTLTATDTRTQGQVSLPVTITANTTTTQDLTFPPVGSVNVTVTLDGQPLYYALVQWQSAARPTWGGSFRTDGAGHATVTNVMGPSFVVRATHPNNANAFGEATATMPSEAASVPVAIDVPGFGSISGTARSLDGVAQPSAMVEVYRLSDNLRLAWTTANSTTGEFSLTNVPEVPVRLVSSFSAPYTYQMVNQAEVLTGLTAHDQSLSLDGLVPRGALSASRSADLWEYTLAQGQGGGLLAIKEANGPHPALADPRLEVYGPDGALVASNDDRGASDKNAEVAFDAPQAGTYVAAVKATGNGAYRVGVWAGGGNGAWAFRRYAGVTVTGHVVRDGTSTPVSGATVRLSAAQPGGLSLTALATTAPDGSYRFESVPATASITVEVIAGGAVVGQASGTSGAVGTTLDLPLTQLALGQVEVRTTYRGANHPGAAIEISSSHPSAPESLTHQTGTTGADGRRVFGVVPAGTITAHATDPISGASVEATGALTDGGSLALELVFTDGGDTVAPGTIGNLSASVPSASVVRLTWTAPGDDGATGTAAAYELRYSVSPITEASFASATLAPPPSPVAAGTGQTFDLTGLAPNQTFYFALKARDEAYNWSALSNVAQATTSSLPSIGLKLWLKADAGVTLVSGTNYVSGWQDQSGANNHAAQTTAASQPLLVAGEVNGLPVLRFDGSNDWISFASRLGTIRTAFWVLRESTSATDGYRTLLGDTNTYEFLSGTPRRIWASGYTSASILNGETRLNGAVVNGLTTNRPTTMTIVSLSTIGAVGADSFGRDRAIAGRYWWGDLAELIVYDRVLSDAERVAVESLLARKYAIYTPTLVAPTASPNGGTISGTTTVSLQAEAGAEIHYTVDGTEPLASSPLYTEPLAVSGGTTLKAKAFASGWNSSPLTTVTFLPSSGFTPANVTGLKLWVRADAGVTGSATTRVERWSDQSGQANDLTQADVFKQPLVFPNAVAGLPALTFDGSNDWLGFTRLTAIRTVFWVVRENPAVTPEFRGLLGDGPTPAVYDFVGDNSASRRIWSSGYTNAYVKNGQTRLNGVVVNGLTTSRPTSMSLISVVTTGPVAANSFSSDRGFANRYWWGELAELVVYDTALSDADRRAVEEYLALRYGITLP